MSGKELANRGDDPYPNDIKAEAIVLVYESGNFSEAARQMGERYPERHPSRQLISRWFKQVDPDTFAALGMERQEAFESGIIELGDKARQRMFDALDDMNSQQVPIPAGISMDKALRLLEGKPSGGKQINVQFNFFTADD